MSFCCPLPISLLPRYRRSPELQSGGGNGPRSCLEIDAVGGVAQGARAVAMVPRAVAVSPSPSLSPSYTNTITYYYHYYFTYILLLLQFPRAISGNPWSISPLLLRWGRGCVPARRDKRGGIGDCAAGEASAAGGRVCGGRRLKVSARWWRRVRRGRVSVS